MDYTALKNKADTILSKYGINVTFIRGNISYTALIAFVSNTNKGLPVLDKNKDSNNTLTAYATADASILKVNDYLVRYGLKWYISSISRINATDVDIYFKLELTRGG